MPTPQNFERSFFQGIECCVLSPEMTDAALGQFTRTTVLGIRSLQTQTTQLPNGQDTEGQNTGQSATRRERTGGQPSIASHVYDWLTAQGGAVKRAEILKALAARFKASSITSALNDLKKTGRAVNEAGLWQAIPQPATTATGATNQAAAMDQTATAREPLRQTG